MSFVAQFGGFCGNCEGPIKPDELIRRLKPGSSDYAHVVCPEPQLTELDLRPREKVCSDCHLVHPREC